MDALTGATVTSKAVVNAINAAVTEPAADEPVEEPAVEASAEPVGEKMTAKAQGFQSEVTVTVTVDAGVITGIEVDSTGETAGFGTRCGEDAAFLNQFIGKAAPLTLGEGVDALTGATVTSTAVVNAVNSMFPAEEVAVEPVAEEIPAEEVATEPAETFTASAKGLLSDVTVTITKNEDGSIATIAVDASGETEAVAKPCTEEAFLSQFVGKVGPFENVDVVSGATFTSNAVITALNSLFPVEEAAVETFTASAKGLLSDVTVTITKNEDGSIATIAVDASGETEAVAKPCTEEAFLSQFVGKVGPFENVDVVSGATFTSNAVITALNSLFE